MGILRFSKGNAPAVTLDVPVLSILFSTFRIQSFVLAASPRSAEWTNIHDETCITRGVHGENGK
jgi:hypothetical protein